MSRIISVGVTYDFFPDGVDQEFLHEALGDNPTDHEIEQYLKNLVLEYLADLLADNEPRLLEYQVIEANI